MKLTKRTVDGLRYTGDGTSRDVRWDDEVPGLGVRVYPSGRKAFVLSYRVNGRKRLMTLKDTRVLTLDAARKQARKVLANLDDVDPLEAKQRIAKAGTVKELCEEYIKRYAKKHKRSWKDDQGRINRRIIPAWGNLKAANIKDADVATLHTKIGATKLYEANRVIELVSKMFELARRWGFVTTDHPNPAANVDHFKELKRDRWVTAEELPKLAEAIDEEGNIFARYALWLYLLTGARRSEVIKAKWQDVDLSRKEWRLPETKAGRVHYVPLSEPALAVLGKVPQVEGNPFVFIGNKPASHLVNIDKPWRRVRDRATVKLWAESSGRTSELVADLTIELERIPSREEVEKAATFELPTAIRDVRLHDLRRTVGSWLAQSGNSLHLIGRVLNHSSQSTTAIYARFGQDHVRQALEQHANKIMGVSKKKPSAEVVAIK